MHRNMRRRWEQTESYSRCRVTCTRPADGTLNAKARTPPQTRSAVVLRGARDDLRSGKYAFLPGRRVRIPKPSGRGIRTLLLPNILDRVVHRAMVVALQPFLDPLFVRNSFGFRPAPAGGYQRAVASLEHLYADGTSKAWVVADIRDAFPSVPVPRLLDVVAKYLPSPDLRRLIRSVVTAESRPQLAQGSPISPLLLNLYLHHLLDRPWITAHPDWPLLRFADDLLVMCPSVEEARTAYDSLRLRVRAAGFKLKQTRDDAVRSVATGRAACWMGFEFRKTRKSLKVQPGQGAWGQLDDALARAQDASLSPLRAIQAILGWVTARAACRPHVCPQRTYRRIANLTRKHAFDEIPDYTEFLAFWNQQYSMWCTLKGAFARGQSPVHPATTVPDESVGELPISSPTPTSTRDLKWFAAYLCHLATEPLREGLDTASSARILAVQAALGDSLWDYCREEADDQIASQRLLSSDEFGRLQAAAEICSRTWWPSECAKTRWRDFLDPIRASLGEAKARTWTAASRLASRKLNERGLAGYAAIQHLATWVARARALIQEMTACTESDPANM